VWLQALLRFTPRHYLVEIMMNAARRLILPAMLVLGSVAGSLLLLEGVLRVFQVVPASGVTTVTEREFLEVPGILTPGQRLTSQQVRKLPYRVTVNSLGYRGPEFPRTKPANEFRVVFAGDSFVYGSFVNDDETYPARLEAELRRFCPHLTVVNAGVGGTTIYTHAAMIERALQLEPDLVLLNFTENDVADLAMEPLWFSLERNREAKSRFPLSLVYPVLRRTALWHLILEAGALVRARGADEVFRGFDGEPEDGPIASAQLRTEYEARYGKLVDTLALHGVPLLSTAYPAHLTLFGEWSEEQLAWFDHLSGQLGIEGIPILGALRSSGGLDTDLYLLPIDGHPSPAGYRIAAEALAKGLLDSGYLGCSQDGAR
jgi:lysophospholipase L1-like esterase